jgi:HPt (histidine-containing phosphotransfer) domain-containing protein
MDGPTATRLIRRLEGEAGCVPIVGLTADTVPEHRRAYEEAGLTDFLTKPINAERLRAALDGSRSGTAMPARPGGTAAVAEAEAEPVLDAKRLNEFSQVLGADGTSELLEVFRKDAAAAVARVAAAVERGDTLEVRRIGHALKGAAVNIGATRLAAVARTLEHAVAGDSELRRLLAELEPTAAAAQRASEGWRPQADAAAPALAQ